MSGFYICLCPHWKYLSSYCIHTIKELGMDTICDGEILLYKCTGYPTIMEKHSNGDKGSSKYLTVVLTKLEKNVWSSTLNQLAAIA